MTSSDLQQLYQQIILDHARARHGSSAVPLGAIADDPNTDDPNTSGLRLAQSHQINTTCGDDVTVRVTLGSATLASGESAEPARVDDIVWSGDGCSISMASASILSDTLRGLSTVEASVVLDAFREVLRSRGTIEPDEDILGDAAAFGGVSRYPARVKCAMLPWVAFEAAVLELEPR